MSQKDDTDKELHLDDLDDEPINGPESVRGESLAPPQSDEEPRTPRVSSLPPPAVTRPTPEALRGSRREPTWSEEMAPNTSPERVSLPAVLAVPRELGYVPAPTSGPKVLIVDDDPDVRGSLKSVLEDEGYNVCEASNGLDGLRRLFMMWPRVDLIMLDLMMPKLNGLEFLSVVQASQASEVPVIVISGNPRSKYAELDDGFVFLRKGDFGDVGPLLDTVRRHVDEGRERRRLARPR